jgi:hypothetical protein
MNTLAEPALLAALKRVARGRRTVALASRQRSYAFGGEEQLRGRKNRFVDPLKVASGIDEAYDRAGNSIDLPVQHAQVVRAAINRGRVIHRVGSRAGALVRDVADAASGNPAPKGRKREWEKSWFRNAVGSAVAAGALLSHAHAMKRNPAYRVKVGRVVARGKGAANQVVPDLFPMGAKVGGLALEDKRPTPMRFDVSAPDWDVRDQRGKSARVFAPGSRKRERREKKSFERVSFLRKSALIGALVSAVGGGALGYRAGVRKGAARGGTGAVTAAGDLSKIVAFPGSAK